VKGAAVDWQGAQSFARDSEGFGPGRRFWRNGWERDQRLSVADPKGNTTPGQNGWRSSPVLDGQEWWVESHAKRADVVRSLRMAGYVARRRYERRPAGWVQRGPHYVPSWRYSEGPATGKEAIDPWDRAEQLDRCSSQWTVQARVTSSGAPLALPIPQGCNQAHICPVCAAKGSRDLARQVRAHIQNQEDGGKLALVTLTHTAITDESLSDALDRWRRAWDLMTKGREGQRFKARIRGYYYGLEVTRNETPWWHVHGHMVVELRPRELVLDPCETCGSEKGQPCSNLKTGKAIKGIHKGRARSESGMRLTEGSIRDWLAKAWEKATEKAKTGKGWDPYAGCHLGGDIESARTCRARIKRGDYSGPWWQSIDRDDLSHVYQACKYPTPITQLSPVHIVEFLAVSHGRRWHQGGLGWRSIKRLGDEAIAAELEEAIEKGTRADLGRPICSMAPGHSPALDDIVRGRGTGATQAKGLREGQEGEPTGLNVRWILSRSEFFVAALWESKGYGKAGTTEIATSRPALPTDDDAVIETIEHKSGRKIARAVVRVRTLHPTFTMPGDLALALLLDTEDLIRPPDSVPDPDPDLAGRAGPPGRPLGERSRHQVTQSPAGETG